MGDGLQDIISAPNIYGSSLGQATDFTRSTWLYRNLASSPTTAPIYTYQTDSYLQGNMIDEGSEAVPARLDLTADGIPDLVIGATERTNATGNIFGGLTLYRGGPAGALALADTDLLSFAARNLDMVFPVAADFNSDGRPDLGVVHSNGFSRTTLIFYPTLAAVGPAGLALDATSPDTIHYTFFAGTHPTFADINADGLIDMILGRDDGVLLYAINQGTPAMPAYPTTVSGYLGYTGGGYLYSPGIAVADFDGSGLPDLVVGFAYHALRYYHDPIWQPGYTAEPDSNLLLTYQSPTALLPYSAGGWQKPLATDVDGDTLPDLLIGTGAGGVLYLQNHLRRPLATRTLQPPAQARLLSNPAAVLKLWLGAPSDVAVYDMLGRCIAKEHTIAGATTLATNLVPGLYTVKVCQVGKAPLNLRWERE